MSADISQSNVKWITLYNDNFWAFPEFIITPSLVIKLSTTTAPDFIDLGPLRLTTGIGPRP